MRRDIEAASQSHPSILRRAAAGLVLIAVAALAIHFAIGLIMTVFWIVVVIAAVAAVLWALRNI